MASEPLIQEDEEGAIRRRWLRDLYARHFAELCHHLRRTFGNGPPDPEDVVHGVFAKLTAMPAPEAIDNPKAFLYAAARNAVVDYHRRAARQASYAADQRLTGEQSSDMTPERILLGKDNLARMEAAIRAMPARQRECLLLHRVHGLGFAEIGRRMGLSDTGVAKIVRKAMEECQRAALQAAEDE